MADENLFGAAVRNTNSPTFAYSGYNHGVPGPDSHNWNSAEWPACLPNTIDPVGVTNNRIPWNSVNDGDGGNTFVEQLTYTSGPVQTWNPAVPLANLARTMLRFEARGPVIPTNTAERYTANYENNGSNMMARCANGQVWNFTVNVKRDTYQGLNTGTRNDITAWVFTCDSSFNTNLGNIATLSEYGDINLGFGVQPNTLIDYGSSPTDPLTAAASSYQFRILDIYYGNTLNQGIPQGPDWNCIDVYFQINESNAQYLSVRIDIDDAQSTGILIDRWALRPMNCSMSSIHNGSNSDISLATNVWSNIQTLDIDP